MHSPNRLKRLILAAGALALALPWAAAAPVAQAAPLRQDNLLPNPGFESGTNSWTAWWAEIPKPNIGYDYSYKPNSFNTESVSGGAARDLVLAGDKSYRILNNWDPFWAGIRQTVNAPAGARVRFAMSARVWAAANFWPAASDPTMPARVRVGIEPNGGGDPFAGSVVWSGEIAPHNGWNGTAVEATVGAGGTVTVFVSIDFRGSSRQFMGAFFDEGSLVVAGAGTPTAPGTPGTPAGVYVVASGDSLAKIARKFNTTIQELLKLNNLKDPNALSIGQQLKVPGAPAVSAPVGGIVSYVVASGDNLSRLARRFNTTVERIIQLNNLKSDVIVIGQTLLIGP